MNPNSDAVLNLAVDRARSGQCLERKEALVLIQAKGDVLEELFEAASLMRDRAKGRIVTFSKKIFLPLTNLCRNYCGYCTFRKDPGEPGAKTMTPDEVLEVVGAGEQLGCKEALFSLGDKPELIFPELRQTLAQLGHRTTIAYLRHICQRVLDESSLFPHVNPGVMSGRDLRELREVSVSMGIMLESVGLRLLKRGGPHFSAPDKHPRWRLRTIEEAGRLQIPFTTGLLIGIGETLQERVDSLLAIRDLHDRYGHIQEVIIQNFRAKPDIPMRRHPEPTLEDLTRTVAVARLIFGGQMNIQAPPNLACDRQTEGEETDNPAILNPLRALLRAGINDWGG
ncbi:MAG: 7,8-didemethyl-8-hydroxy-5-deazariboflavin synthase CofG, partial [Acidobacteria bacterium]|nr:7,8-didemethyl-8-hydroxy-5-deazariboflavin synthase CofG [Acidobacteriota bacterium]